VLVDNQPWEHLTELCKALGHPVRMKIIQILTDKNSCISGDLAEYFDKAPSTVSEHLKVLKDANLVIGSIDGPKRCYCVNADTLKQMEYLIGRFTNGTLPNSSQACVRKS